MFKDIFGNSPQTKILDFLADHPKYDYSISEIAEKADVSRPTVYKVIDILLLRKLIVKTRMLGRSSLYKLDLKNELVKIMLKFDFEIAKKYADLEEVGLVEKYRKSFDTNTIILKE